MLADAPDFPNLQQAADDQRQQTHNMRSGAPATFRAEHLSEVPPVTSMQNPQRHELLASLDGFLAELNPRAYELTLPLSLTQVCAIDHPSVVPNLSEAEKKLPKDIAKLLELQCQEFRKKATTFDDALKGFSKDCDAFRQG